MEIVDLQATDSLDRGGAPTMATEVSYACLPPTKRKFDLAKQMAQDIVSAIFINADSEAKRPRVPKIDALDDSGDKSSASPVSDHSQQPVNQQLDSTCEKIEEHSQKALEQQLDSVSPESPFPTYKKIEDHSQRRLDMEIDSVSPKSPFPTHKKIEIPNERASVVIGKFRETVKNLMLQSGAKIHIARYMDVDPNAPTRAVEIFGTSKQISKAEQLISNVPAETEYNGSGVIAAWKVGSDQVRLGAVQSQMKIPHNKVGYVIGKGGETIKSIQEKSGAYIKVIASHLPPGDAATERTLNIDGTLEQIEAAKQLINELICENRVKNPTSRGYPSHGHRPPHLPSRGPPVVNYMQQPGHGYIQPGAYLRPPPQFNTSQTPYGTYPPTASGGYPNCWDQTSNQPTQSQAPTTGYYNQQPSQQQNVGISVAADGTTYDYGQTTAGQQQGYGLAAAAPQFGYSQPLSNTAGYDQQGYASTPGYGTTVSPIQDGSTVAYGAQGGSCQLPHTQLPSNQQGHANQFPVTSSLDYSAQGSAPTVYGSFPYGNPLAQSGYGQSAPTQPSYGAPPPIQHPPSQAVYGLGQQSMAAQGGYMQLGAVPESLPSHAQDSTHRPPASHGQQPYGDAYGSGGFSQPSISPSDNATQGARDATAAAPTASAEATKTSPG